MNLQLVMPFEPCIYDCPFCVARGHKHQYAFANLYDSDKETYFKQLAYIYTANRYDTVIFTGEADPSQRLDWVHEVSTFLKSLPQRYVPFEISTRNASLVEHVFPTPMLVSVSCHTMEHLNEVRSLHAKNPVRVVMILSDLFKIDLRADWSGINQYTFKEMNASEDILTNAWMKAHAFTDQQGLRELCTQLSHFASVRYDQTCQLAANRYVIFRTDGRLYTSWEEEPLCNTFEKKIPQQLKKYADS